MQTTGSMRAIGKSGAQALLLAAVGVLGLGIGRWVVPATDSGQAEVYRPAAASTNGRAPHIVELKLAQMDAADVLVRTAAEVTGPASIGRASHIVRLKLAAMDYADAR